MPEPVVPALDTAPESTPTAPIGVVVPQETALTRTEVAALIAANKAEVEVAVAKGTKAAYDAARRSEAKADAANARLARQEAAFEVIATRGMDETEARLWKAERAEQRTIEASTQVSAQQEQAQQVAAFQQRSADYLNAEGIKPEDPRLTAAFSKYAEGYKTGDDLDKALMRAVADVHKSERQRIEGESKTLVEKVREEERAKLRNETRAADGKLDKGTPATATKVDWATLSDEEFKALDAQRDEDRRRRQRLLR